MATEDGSTRLLSPSTGRCLTIALPLLEIDIAIDVTYSSRTKRLFTLLKNGQIWILTAKTNPCQVVDVWNSNNQSRENCCLIAIYELGKEVCIPKSTTSPSNKITPMVASDNSSKNGASTPLCTQGLTILLGGTENGQIIVFGRDSYVKARLKLHTGRVTLLDTYAKQGRSKLSPRLISRHNRELWS